MCIITNQSMLFHVLVKDFFPLVLLPEGIIISTWIEMEVWFLKEQTQHPNHPSFLINIAQFELRQ